MALEHRQLLNKPTSTRARERKALVFEQPVEEARTMSQSPTTPKKKKAKTKPLTILPSVREEAPSDASSRVTGPGTLLQALHAQDAQRLPEGNFDALGESGTSPMVTDTIPPEGNGPAEAETEE